MFSSVGGWVVKDTDSISGVESATHQRFSSLFHEIPTVNGISHHNKVHCQRFSSSLTCLEVIGNCYRSLLEGALFEVTRHFTGLKSVTKTLELFCPESLFKVTHNRQNIIFREHHFPVILQGWFFFSSSFLSWSLFLDWCGHFLVWWTGVTPAEHLVFLVEMDGFQTIWQSAKIRPSCFTL